MLHGSCCCGEVRFTVSETPKFLAECHCSRCRKLGATPFVMVGAETFELVSGREKIVEFPPTPPFKYMRSFCGVCGTSLGELTTDSEMFPISANCFDDELELPVHFHEHVGTKPSWVTIPDGVKQFEGDPG